MQDLVVERQTVERCCHVSEDGEGDDDGDEFAEATSAGEHCCEDSADGVVCIALCPFWVVGDSTTNGSAKDDQEDCRD